MEYESYYLIPNYDLYQVFKNRVEQGKFSYHPHTWLTQCYISPMVRCNENSNFLVNNTFLVGDMQTTERIFRGNHTRGIPRFNKFNYYRCNSELVDSYISDMDEMSINERSIQDSLEYRLKDSRREEYAGLYCGKIDLIFENKIIEIKKFSQWKHALGQILVYALNFPSMNRNLILFKGEIDFKKLDVIKSICESYDVNVLSIDRATCLNNWLLLNNEKLS